MELLVVRSVFFVALLLLVAVAPVCVRAGSSIFVSSSLGDDNANDGLSAASPLRTLGRAMRDVKDASKTGPGDALLLRRGDFWETEGIEFRPEWGSNNTFGNSTHPFVFGAYGNAVDPRPKLIGNRTGEVVGIRSTGPQGSPTIAQHIVIRDLHITSNRPHSDEVLGFQCLDSFYGEPHHITLENVVISDCGAGIVNYCDFLTVSGCSIVNNHNLGGSGHSQGLYTQAAGLVVRESLFERNGKFNSWFDHNMYLSHVRDALIEHCLVHNALDGIKVRLGANITIRANIFEGLALGGSSCGGDSAGNVTDVLYERNVFTNTRDSLNIRGQSGSGFGAFGVVVRQNLFFARMPSTTTGNYGSYAFVGSDVIDGIVWAHNLFFDIQNENDFSVNPAAPMGTFVWQNNVVFKTNNSYLYSDTAVCFKTDANFDVARATMSNNLYYAGPAVAEIWRIDGASFLNISALRAAYPGLEAQTHVGDPLFLDGAARDWRPTVGSPLINAGAPAVVSGAFPALAEDFWRVPRTDGMPDIGPFEYVPGGALAQPCAQLGGFLCDGAAPICPLDMFYPQASEGTRSCCLIPCQTHFSPGPPRECGHGCTGPDPQGTRESQTHTGTSAAREISAAARPHVLL